MSNDRFSHLVQEIKADRITIAAAADALYEELFPDEQLALLQGKAHPVTWVKDIITLGYCGKPVIAAEVARLGIPGIRFSDGPRGLNTGTAFPTPSARANTFNVDLEERIGQAIGRELRAFGGNYFGGVCVNLAPNPKWGRTQESHGEDPLLIGSMGSALCRGVSVDAMACVKHFALNSAENKRFSINVECDEDVMHECYLPHFRQCLEEGGAESLMSAYNMVNGEYCGENRYLLNEVVRDVWGLENVVITSDWCFGFRDAAKSISAGLDIEMPWRSIRATHLPKLIQNGQVDPDDITTIGKRKLRALLKYYVRIDGSPTPPREIIRCERHRTLAREAATQSMVLLKNDDILPLNSKITRLVVIGELAVSTQTGDKGSSDVRGDNVISPLAGLKAQPDVIITYVDGKDVSAAISGCSEADAVFCLVGYTGSDEGEGGMENLTPSILHATIPNVFPYEFLATLILWLISTVLCLVRLVTRKKERYGGDRVDMKLRQSDENLVLALAETVGDKLIIGLETSSPVILPSKIRNQAAAILVTGYGGSQFGHALRDVLFGEAEPTGRLAYNIPITEEDVSSIKLDAPTVRYGRWWGYRLLQKEGKRAAYPFGFGLGYGQVAFDAKGLCVPTLLRSRFFDVPIPVENVGERETDWVVQVYAGKVDNRIDYKRVLVGFTRINIPVGKMVVATVKCRLDPVSHWNAHSRGFDVAAGDYRLEVGSYEGNDSVSAVVPADRISWSARV